MLFEFVTIYTGSIYLLSLIGGHDLITATAGQGRWLPSTFGFRFLIAEPCTDSQTP